MKRKFIIVIILFSISFGGCEQAKKLASNKGRKEVKPKAEQVESPELAKLILKPSRDRLNVSRDPFKPLNWEEYSSEPIAKDIDTYEMMGFRFLGVARVAGHYVAFLKSSIERGTYKIDDVINDFTIKNILSDRVILSNGEQTITLKRGNEIERQ